MFYVTITALICWLI